MYQSTLEITKSHVRKLEWFYCYHVLNLKKITIKTKSFKSLVKRQISVTHDPKREDDPHKDR